MFNHIDELKKLNLPIGEYAIFGSGPMAIRHIRDLQDIDIVVKQNLWNKLAIKYKDNIEQNPERIVVKNIEIFKDWLDLTDKIDEIINTAEEINGLSFVKLNYVIEWKEKMGREKDIKLIKEFQKNSL